MAVTFTDLHTESGLKSIIEFLSGKSYISVVCCSFPGKVVGVRVGDQAFVSEAYLAEEDIQQRYGGVTYARIF
ncbi:hypothetical protein Scep_019060 [Stephania cephalantha]|uniref:Uncharacterized protein n=1 Tax=Stephania cephalantha TaxID=152367 RepID=A0AAP0IB40_9MAGN